MKQFTEILAKNLPAGTIVDYNRCNMVVVGDIKLLEGEFEYNRILLRSVLDDSIITLLNPFDTFYKSDSSISNNSFNTLLNI